MALTSVTDVIPIPEVVRPKRQFTPCVWGDRLSSFSSVDDQESEKCLKEVGMLKEQVKGLLVSTGTKPEEKLNLINTIERLGISYHFGEEIAYQLEDLYRLYADDHKDVIQHYDLHNTALIFRIFRQHGYKVSSDIFSKFKSTTDSKFDDALASDVMGMLSLYEATHLRIHGDDILEEALAFTTSHLKEMVACLNDSMGEQVRHALEQPLHKGVPRVEAKYFIRFYEEDPSKNHLLLRLAKIDFNLVQSLYKKEICQLMRWNDEWELASKLPYTRNRVVESFFWGVAVYPEPRYSYARSVVTKWAIILTIIDDTYDSFATIEELHLFTTAIRRWDTSMVHELPDYMKFLYKIILEHVDEIDGEIIKQGASYSSSSFLKEALKAFVENYYVEAKWRFADKYVPSYDEYFANASRSIGLCAIGVITYIAAMGAEVIPDDLEYTLAHPKFVMASCIYVRLRNDLMDHGDKQEDITAIDCYMKDYGVSKEECIAVFNKMIDSTWKDINEELLRPTLVSNHLIVLFLNFMRMIFETYKHDNGYTHPEEHMKDIVAMLFIDAITI